MPFDIPKDFQDHPAVLDGTVFPCIRCGGPATKAMYCGIPLRLCSVEDCHMCWGIGDFMLLLMPFNVVFIRYQSYWSALWAFITNTLPEEHKE